jgi:hypothetical protein
LGAATITRVATSTWLFYRTHPALVIFNFSKSTLGGCNNNQDCNQYLVIL